MLGVGEGRGCGGKQDAWTVTGGTTNTSYEGWGEEVRSCEAGGTLGHAMRRAAGVGRQAWRRLGIVGQV